MAIVGFVRAAIISNFVVCVRALFSLPGRFRYFAVSRALYFACFVAAAASCHWANETYFIVTKHDVRVSGVSFKLSLNLAPKRQIQHTHSGWLDATFISVGVFI